jgi:hypothetical protein
MRIFFASFVTLITLSSIANVAYANGDNSGTGGSSSSTSFTSNHTGFVIPTCSLKVDDGVLPENQDLVSNLTSSTKGKISTICNSAGSSLSVSLDTGAVPAQPNLSQLFKLNGGTGAYSGFNMANFGTTYSKSNLTTSVYSNNPSTLDVIARAIVPNSQVLAAGNYLIRVKATVTP